MYRNINSLVTSHFGREIFFDGKLMINVSICRWYSLIDWRERENMSKEKERETGTYRIGMIHFSNSFFFVTITKRLRVVRIWVWVCVCFFTSLFVYCVGRLFLLFFVYSQGTCPFASVLSIYFLFLFFLLSAWR